MQNAGQNVLALTQQPVSPAKNAVKGAETRKSKFVEPWPLDKNYLNKSGNALTPEFERHFSNHCFKCGHMSHRGQDCRIYPSNTAILSLCSSCRQGLHDECKSKRPDLVKQRVAKLSANMDGFARDGLLYGGMYQPWFDPYGPWQGFPVLSSSRPTLPSITED
jgi:hypothetical protein